MCKLWNRFIHVTSEAICKYPPLSKGFFGGEEEHILCGLGSCATVHVAAAFEVWTSIEEIGNTMFWWQNTSFAAWHFPTSFSDPSFPLCILVYCKRIHTESPDTWLFLRHFETNVCMWWSKFNLGNSCLSRKWFAEEVLAVQCLLLTQDSVNVFPQYFLE